MFRIRAARDLTKRMGVMFQDGALFSSLTVRENVEVPLRTIDGLDAGLRRDLADLKIAMSGLPYKAGEQLPLGTVGRDAQTRGPCARAGAGPRNRVSGRTHGRAGPNWRGGFLTKLIRGLSRAMGLTVFMVTHDLDSLHACCDRDCGFGGQAGEVYRHDGRYAEGRPPMGA